MSRKAAVIVGVGDSLGASIAKRFAREGLVACVARREEAKLAPLVAEIEAAGGAARAFGVHAHKEDETAGLFETVEAEVGPVEVAVFNVGAWYTESILTIEAWRFRKIWEMACFGGFLTGREAARRMVARGRGTILFTGATASKRGAAGFAAFAGAKGALRQLAESMARELGPKGIHVAHVVVDGPIDTPFVRERFTERVASAPEDGLLVPDAIAENYWRLHVQPRNAWTFELDLRPWIEKW